MRGFARPFVPSLRQQIRGKSRFVYFRFEPRTRKVGGLPYMTSEMKGGSINTPKFADKHFRFCGQRGGPGGGKTRGKFSRWPAVSEHFNPK